MSLFDIFDAATLTVLLVIIALFLFVLADALVHEWRDWRDTPTVDVEADTRPLSSAVTRLPAADPVEQLMRTGMPADDAVRQIYEPRVWS